MGRVVTVDDAETDTSEKRNNTENKARDVDMDKNADLEKGVTAEERGKEKKSRRKNG